ncbi:SpoIIE family protein phosphatase [Streptomyces sp. NPDC000348]|uniref:SpoIIE family protein phosphatase n=1 Tax=Streptomyces sp. NPDC000348 TaxID=3364538 RepID=UPI0036B7555A
MSADESRGRSPGVPDSSHALDSPEAPDVPVGGRPLACGRTGAALRRARDEIRIGSWEWDIPDGRLFCDDAALRVFGLSRARFDGRFETWRSLIHPQDLPWVLAEIEKAARSGQVHSVEYRLRRPDGSVGWAHARGRTVLDEAGQPVYMVGTVWDSTRSRIGRDTVGRGLRYMSDGFFAVDRDWRIVFVNLEAERLLGSSRQVLCRVLWDVLPEPVRQALRTHFRRAVAAGAPTGFDLGWPGTGRWFHLRLVPMPEALAVYLTDITDKRLRERERAAAERAAAERAALMGELTGALAEAATLREVVDAVAVRVLPPFGAAGLFVHTVAGGRVRLVGNVGYPPDLAGRMPAGRVPPGSPLAEVLRGRRPRFLSSADEFAAYYPWLAGLPATGHRAWALLPVAVSGQETGCCVIAFAEPRRFSGEERTLLTAVSGLVAQALGRGRMFDAERNRSRALQRALLPSELPGLSTVTAAVRYLPAGRDMEVGGDWYDIIPLPSERIALVIGDVMGHGLTEAATMGRLRTAVHTLTDLEMPPDELLTRLNDIVGGLGDDFYATCLYAVYDATTRVCSLARAGHPPPAVVAPDGSVRFLDVRADPPLGAATYPYELSETELPDGSLLVLYTDGLVESAGQDVDTGMARLAGALAAALPRHGPPGAEQLQRLCDTVTGTLLPPERRTPDDAALLIALPRGLDAGSVASWPLPDDPTAAGLARRLVRRELDAWRLEELETTTELLVSELVGNVVRHAAGPVRLRLLRTTATLICEVSDGSATSPRIRRARPTDEGGRGLQLIAALSHRWGTRFTPAGKLIWTEQSLPAADLGRPYPSTAA